MKNKIISNFIKISEVKSPVDKSNILIDELWEKNNGCL